MFDYLFSGGTILTMDNDNIIKQGFIGVTGQTIEYVGAVRPTKLAKTEIDCKNKVLLPGLINTHCHSAMSLVRSFADDLTLEQWYFDKILPTEASFTRKMVYAGANLAIAEMIANGITCFADMYFYLGEVAKAATETGIRANLCNALVDFDEQNFVLENDRSYKDSIEVLEQFHQDKSGGLVVLDAGIHDEYTTHPKVWRAAIDFANKHSVNFHIHLSETEKNHNDCIARRGKTPAQVFFEHGVFDIPCLAAHCIHLSQNDIDILSEKKVSVAFNAISNLKLTDGILNAHQLIQRGVNVSFGTDGAGSNNNIDLLAEIKTGTLLQKELAHDPTVFPAKTAINCATKNAAKALKRDSIGTIREGYLADIIAIDFNKPSLVPSYDPVSSIVYSARGSDVCLTMVNGKILYQDGNYTTIDIEKVLFQANEIASGIS